MHQLNRERKRQQEGFLQFHHAPDPSDHPTGDRNDLQKYLSINNERPGDGRDRHAPDQRGHYGNLGPETLLQQIFILGVRKRSHRYQIQDIQTSWWGGINRRQFSLAFSS